MKTLPELAKDALEVQNACNLSGVAQGFARAMISIRELPECTGTEYCNRHPITIAWLDKLNSLAGIPSLHPSIDSAFVELYALVEAGDL